uniref:Fibronectin type-III domain-containing protein n=1 Tax=Heterorhabditis bacteriophora TaxID=37862 RepID=A0A1I7W989_HETBA
MFGRSASSGISVTRTYESTPTAAPRNVRAEAVNIRSVSVRWDPVDKEFTNGYILGYTVRLEPESQLLKEDCTRQVDISDGNTLMTTLFLTFNRILCFISDLRAFTSYMVFVSAYTVVGRGPENLLIVIQTGEDFVTGKLYLAALLITCETIKFSYLAGLVPNELYVFTIQAENTIGVGPETEVKVLTSSVRVPLRNPPLPLRNESVPYTSTEIAIRWDDFSIDEEEETPVRFVKVEYEKANGNGWVSLDKNIGGYQKGIVVTRLSANSLYRFRIRYQGDSSLSVWSAESSWMRTLPSPPFTPPNSIVSSPYDSNSLLMQWNAPPRHVLFLNI